VDSHPARRAIFHILLEQAVKFFPQPSVEPFRSVFIISDRMLTVIREG